jgi:septal ring-binding cell division protein DamX
MSLFIMKKAIVLLLILALIISSAGCAVKNDKETRVQKAPDAREVRNNATQAENTSQAAHRPLAERPSSGSNVMQDTNTSQPTVSPTGVDPTGVDPTGLDGKPYAEWKYIDPSLLTVSGEEDEKIIDF